MSRAVSVPAICLTLIGCAPPHVDTDMPREPQVFTLSAAATGRDWFCVPTYPGEPLVPAVHCLRVSALRGLVRNLVTAAIRQPWPDDGD